MANRLMGMVKYAAERSEREQCDRQEMMEDNDC